MDIVKRIDCSFFDKAVYVSASDILQSSLENIEGIFKECNGLLSEAGMPECSYAFQEGAISEMTGNLETLLLYVETANDHVWEELDHSLYMDFKDNATETLSRIVLEEISTENTFGMEEHMQRNRQQSGLPGLRFPASPLPTGPVNQSNVAYPFLLCLLFFNRVLYYIHTDTKNI